jgi:hypothetical protein
MELVGPFEDLRLRHVGKFLDIADIPFIGEELCQGAVTQQTAQAEAQSVVYGHPRLEFRPSNATALFRGPSARRFAIGVGPGQDFSNVQGTPAQSLHGK